MPYDEVSIIKLREGVEPTLVFINGFLQENDKDYEDWILNTANHFPSNACYGLSWPSSSFWEVFNEVHITTKTPMSFAPIKKAKKISSTFASAWNEALENSRYAAQKLAHWLSEREQPVILMGHSLGARIIHNALVELKAQNSSPKTCEIVQDIYLLGGAITTELTEWQKIEDTFSGTLYNIYSENDLALKRIYYLLTRGEEAIGINEIDQIEEDFLASIPLPEKIKNFIQSRVNLKDEEDIALDLRIVNFNASDFVPGHTTFKQEYHKILSNLHKKD